MIYENNTSNRSLKHVKLRFSVLLTIALTVAVTFQVDFLLDVRTLP